MAKTLIWSVTVIVTALILATGSIEAPPQPKITEVTGTVDVGNLPVVQEVVGTVDVGNLPLDAEGNVRVSNVPTCGTVHFVGYTQEFEPGGALSASRVCDQTFPGTRMCVHSEFFLSSPIPPPYPPEHVVFVAPNTTEVQLGCADAQNGGLYDSGCPSGIPTPAACCGF